MTRMVTSYRLPIRDDSAQLYKNSRGKRKYLGAMRVAVFGRVSQIWMTIDSPTPPPLSLLLFPEPTVVQILFKDSSVVLLLLLTQTTLFSP